MGNQRILLYFALFFIIYMIWAQWQMDYGPKPEPVISGSTDHTAVFNDVSEDIPQAVSAGNKTGDRADDTADKNEPLISSGDGKEVARSQRIKIITDVLDVEIDTRGGDIRRTVLRKYSVTAEDPEEKLVLMTDENVNYFVAQSGLVSVNKGTAPSHNTIFRSDKNIYRLAEGVDQVVVPLYWENDNGVKVNKVLIFKRNDYVVDVNYYITAGDEQWTGSDYMQITRSLPVETNANAFIRTYTGGVVYNDEIKYEKYDFDDIAEDNLSY